MLEMLVECAAAAAAWAAVVMLWILHRRAARPAKSAKARDIEGGDHCGDMLEEHMDDVERACALALVAYETFPDERERVASVLRLGANTLDTMCELVETMGPEAAKNSLRDMNNTPMRYIKPDTGIN